jgi:hypothetical protein
MIGASLECRQYLVWERRIEVPADPDTALRTPGAASSARLKGDQTGPRHAGLGDDNLCTGRRFFDERR